MMGDLVNFVPRSNLEGRDNLAAFIRLAKFNLVAFGLGESWEGCRWQEGKTVVVFSTKTVPGNAYAYTPMAAPFLDFAKAYVRYRYSHRPVVSLHAMMFALRCIEAGLIATHGRADVLLLNGATMDVCAQKCREFFLNDQTRAITGRHMQSIFDFIREKHIVPGLSIWRSPFRKPRILTEDLGEEGRKHREAKLPSNESMMMAADMFASADDAETLYYMSIVALLMATPSRISEVLELPIDCVQWEEAEDGSRQMYLRWRAAKGKGPTKKWVVPAMQSVVLEAVERLVRLGAPARTAARYAFDNPGCFMPHDACITHPDEAGNRPLAPSEIYGALNRKVPVKANRGAKNALGNLKIGRKLKGFVHDGGITYRDLSDHVLALYSGPYWPYINRSRSTLSWEALCLHRENELHKAFAPKAFSWRIAKADELNSRLAPDYGRSIFDRRGLKNPDGSSVRLTTHQFRHWLSTMSERAGMDDFTLAQWAGRAKATDNRYYDHRTTEERLSAAKQLLRSESRSLLEKFQHRRAVTYQELGVDRLGTAKATLYGMCIHDYAMAPCQKQRECMTCSEHVCIKGDHVTLERVRLLEAQTDALLRRAQHAHEEGDFGADRWVDNHKWKLAHVRAMRAALEHKDLPDGTPLRIPDGHDPSAVRRALIELKMVELPSGDVASLEVVPSITQ